MPHIPIERHTLPNGLRVVLSQDRVAPLVAVNLWYDVGSRHELPGKTGFAHLFEHMMFAGTAGVPKGQFWELVQGVGGTLNASTWATRTNYFETLPSHELELGLWLEADRLANLLPGMTQEKLDNQREVVKNERRFRVDNQPYGTAEERIQALIYPPDHPYHHTTIGSMVDLDAASLEDVTYFFRTHYAPNNAVLTVAGDFDPGEALEMIGRHFGPIARNPDIPAAPDMTVAPILGEERRETIPDKVPLPRVIHAYRIPPYGTPGFEVMQVAADLLGAGRASRLYARLVRDQRLAQDVSVFPLDFVGGAAVFALWATASPGVKVDLLETALLTEVDRLTAGGPSDAELERVRNLHAASVESSLERIAERADRLSMYTCLFDDPARINTELSRYQAVDAGQVRDLMASCLRADNRVVLTYVPVDTAEAIS